ncbi:MAG: cyclase family protein [Planctomycetes bacterium]|nr:cyclase family protein [Planctomycetota bacterium]
MKTHSKLFAGCGKIIVGIVCGAFLATVSPWASGDPQAQPATKSVIGEKFWPSEFGAEDQRGAANRLTPEKVVSAARMIKDGDIYQLGRLYEHGMPLPGKRHFSLTIPGRPTGGPMGANQMVSNDELVSGEIGQVGTQFDGLGHVGMRVEGEDYFYNGNKLSEFGDPYGLKKLGVENVGVFFTRGILLDVCALRGADRLRAGYVISPDELEACLKKANLTIQEGDVVLIRTGHGKLWMKDNLAYGEGEPGIGLAAAKFLTDRKVSMIGADTWAIEAVPHESEELGFPVHQWDLTKNGVYHIENLDLEQLAADEVYEFCFVFSPLRLKGATGSPGNPIAIR